MEIIKWNVIKSEIWKIVAVLTAVVTGGEYAATAFNITWQANNCQAAVFRRRPRKLTTEASPHLPEHGICKDGS